MRKFASLLILLASACGSGNPAHQPSQQNVARPAHSGPPPAAPAANTTQATQAVPDEAPSDGPGLADLSPAQRRAYDLGYRDCSHGHYAPDNHLEAYRIGCGAAHDRMEGDRPQG
jgi:hypothetical protein